MSISFSFPMSQHTGTSLRNLLHLLYSRGQLISKATGGQFAVSEGLIDALKEDSCVYSVEDFLRAVQEYQAQHGTAVHGITLDLKQVCFDGFPEVTGDHTQAFLALASAMNQQSLQQKRILPRVVKDENKKYSMRIWLIRIGMGGAQHIVTFLAPST